MGIPADIDGFRVPTEPPAEPPAEQPQRGGALLDAQRTAIWAWVFGYAALLTSLSVLRAQLWLATGFDLGLYSQGLWQILHEGLRAATSYTGQPILAYGGSWILIPLAPLFAIGGTGLLFSLQSVALGLGYYFIRRIARVLAVHDRTAHLAGIVYLLFPTLLGANLFDFHPAALAVPLLFALVWSALERRRLTFALLALAALVTQSSVVVPLLAVGLVLLLLGRPQWGLATAAGALLGLWLDTRLLGAATGLHLSLWATAIPSAVAPRQAATQLLASLHRLRSWEYLAWLAGPAATLLLSARPRQQVVWLLPALVVVASNLLSTTLAATSPFSDTSLVLLPFIFVATLGVQAGRAPVVGNLRRVTLLISALALVVFLYHQSKVSWHALPSNITSLVAAAALVPPRTPVVAQNFVEPELSARPEVLLPGQAAKRRLPVGTYILLDNRFSTRVTPAADIAQLQKTLAGDKEAKRLYAHNGVVLYTLQAPLGTGAQ